MTRKAEQLDLFNDWEEARVFHCIGGYYIGHFNRACDPMNEDDPGPVIRLSTYFSTEAEAQTALASGAWEDPAPGQF